MVTFLVVVLIVGATNSLGVLLLLCSKSPPNPSRSDTVGRRRHLYAARQYRIWSEFDVDVDDDRDEYVRPTIGSDGGGGSGGVSTSSL
jgi:hypothetical protein